MKFYFIFLLGFYYTKFLEATCSIPLALEFEKFLKQYKICFPNPAEYSYRFQVFSDNIDLIRQINSNPNVTYVAGVNKFSALVNIE